MMTKIIFITILASIKNMIVKNREIKFSDKYSYLAYEVKITKDKSRGNQMWMWNKNKTGRSLNHFKMADEVGERNNNRVIFSI